MGDHKQVLTAVRDHAGQIAALFAKRQGPDDGHASYETDAGEWTVQDEAGDLEELPEDPSRGSEV